MTYEVGRIEQVTLKFYITQNKVFLRSLEMADIKWKKNLI